MSDIDLPEIERIQVVSAQPGDVIVVTLPAETHPATFNDFVKAISGRFNDLFPMCEVLYIAGGAEVRVVRPDGGG